MTLRRFVTLLSFAIFAYVGYKLATSPLSLPDLQRLSVSTVLALLLARLIQLFVAVVQWKILQNRLSPVSLGLAAKVILPSLYAIYFPLRGTVVLLRLQAARDGGVPYTEGGASLLVHFVSKWAFMTFALVLLPFAFPSVPLEVYLLPGGLVVLLAVAYGLRRRVFNGVVKTIRWVTGSAFAARVGVGVAEVEEKVWVLLRSRAMLTYAALWAVDAGVSYWAIYLVWGDLGYAIPYFQILLAGFLAFLVGLLAPLPGGFGPLEATYAAVLSVVGVPVSVGVIATLLWRVVFMAVDFVASGVSNIGFALVSRKIQKALDGKQQMETGEVRGT